MTDILKMKRKLLPKTWWGHAVTGCDMIGRHYTLEELSEFYDILDEFPPELLKVPMTWSEFCQAVDVPDDFIYQIGGN